MQSLNLPTYVFRIKTEDGKKLIFDTWRKKWIRLSPEEWVRQHFVRFLVDEMKYPSSSIGIEVGLTINGRRLRADALVYNKNGDIALLMEFKAPSVLIDEAVFAQTADYNTALGAPYILISNGIHHFFAKANKSQLSLLACFPAYADLV